jgi:Asp-tRNA(Asn)/Glu-tRNA(Gln) amidotransferase A subunit family amidase
MIAREEPSDAVDFQTAFNPRGDGYQSPAGSSSGSAAAVASYGWLDCALGTDTSGSGRRPALVNGIFQFRPSHDAAPLDGMVPTFLQFDTPCVFARNLDVLEDVLSAWLPRAETRLEQSNSNLEIIYPFDYLPTRIPGQMEIFDSFVDDMATHLNATITKVSIRKCWEEAPPNSASSNIEEFLKDVIIHTYYYSFYHSSDAFRTEYSKKFNRKPYVIPFVEQRWASGATVSTDQYEEGLRKLEIYRTWLLGHIFKEKKTLMVLPISPVEPHYRDERTESPSYQTATDELFLSPILHSPDIVIPIGEIPYQSRITGNQEQLPVAINVVGTPGMDYWVLESMRTVLQKSGRPWKVKSGSRMF